MPSFLIKAGDLLELREVSRKLPRFQEMSQAMERKVVPPWLELDKGNMKGKVVSLPSREDIDLPVNESLIIELYSK